MQNDYNDYVQAHGAKYRGRDTAIANMIKQVNSAYANEFKYRTFQDTANMYRQNLNKDQQDYVNDLLNGKASYSAPTPAATAPVTTTWNPTQYDWYRPVSTSYTPDAFKLDWNNLWRTMR